MLLNGCVICVVYVNNKLKATGGIGEKQTLQAGQIIFKI
jgi:hypothetical protein